MNKGSIRARLLVGLGAVAIVAGRLLEPRRVDRAERRRIRRQNTRSASRTRRASATAGARR